MRRILLGLALAALAGCTVAACATSPLQQVLSGPVLTLTLNDAISAQGVLTASAPLLPPNDPWLGCMQTIQGMISAVQAGPGSVQTTNGILTEASRLHVLDAMMSQASTSQGQQTCAQIILAIELRMAAGATPGGAILPIR